jgi:hypothetical protein
MRQRPPPADRLGEQAKQDAAEQELLERGGAEGEEERDRQRGGATGEADRRVTGEPQDEDRGGEQSGADCTSSEAARSAASSYRARFSTRRTYATYAAITAGMPTATAARPGSARFASTNAPATKPMPIGIRRPG